MRIICSFLYLFLCFSTISPSLEAADVAEEEKEIFSGMVSLETHARRFISRLEGTKYVDSTSTFPFKFQVARNKIELDTIEVNHTSLAGRRPDDGICSYYGICKPEGPTGFQVINFFIRENTFKLDAYYDEDGGYPGCQDIDFGLHTALKWFPLTPKHPSSKYQHVALGKWNFSYSDHANNSIQESGFFSFGDHPTSLEQWQSIAPEVSRYYIGEFFYREGQGLMWFFFHDDGSLEVSFLLPHLEVFIVKKIDLVSWDSTIASFTGESDQGKLEGIFYGDEGDEGAGAFSLSDVALGDIFGVFCLKQPIE